MFKSDNYPSEVIDLQISVEELDIGVRAIIEEHERFSPKGSDKEIWSWFSSFPIESLRESLDFDLKRYRAKYSLKDMKYKFHLRKMYNKAILQLEEKKSELQLAKVNYLLKMIQETQSSLAGRSYASRPVTAKAATLMGC